MVDALISYSSELIGKESPPIFVTNDRQLHNLFEFFKKENVIRLCVTFNDGGGDQKSRVKIDLNQEPHDSDDEEEHDNQNMRKNNDSLPRVKKGFVSESEWNEDIKSEIEVGDDDELLPKDVSDCEENNLRVVNDLKLQQYFKSKTDLTAYMEICAMKHNFDYKIDKSCTRWWCIRCKDDVCNWRLRAESPEGSTYFRINKYVAEHTCAPSKKSKFSRNASAKTIGHLITQKYEGVKEGPKPNDIINIMRKEHGCEITYSKAWESREYAVNTVRGIPEKSYLKIPKYLHMLQQSNPGTHTSYESDDDDRFKYLFISFGQCIRGFYKAVRKVIVVDGTFLKNKYKGVLLVATAVDGNSNLYPIAFGIVDSENDRSWDWFLTQLKVVIADNESLAFVSDRHASIMKSLENVYPLAKHGICIHHLLNNVVTSFKTKGISGLVAKASKAYRVVDFEKLFDQICRINPLLGNYLLDADVKKWSRCYFPGYRFDIRTTNPTESINSVLRSPREYPLIPLLDSIREILTRWFYERRELSAKHKDPLTPRVEKMIARRIEKAKTLIAFPVTTYIFQVKGGKFDCVVDLEKRTCSCGKFELGKIPCRHAIKGAFSRGLEIHTLVDEVYKSSAWRLIYAESINPIVYPEDEWRVPHTVEDAQVLPPETRRGPGRRRKRRHETVEDKIKSSQESQKHKKHKCSRCGKEGHNRATCDIVI